MGQPQSLVAAAHELKAPLALIRQLSLLMRGQAMSGAEASRFLEQITVTSESALRLTSDLTRSARLQDTLFALEPLNPIVFCEDIAHQLVPLFQAHDREIRVKTRNRSVLMVANRDLLARVLMNFCDNALHYSQTGSPVEIAINESISRATVRLGVRDYGPALSSDMFRQLEKRLGQTEQSLSGRPASSGLGLYLAGQFARAMQATIGMTRHRDGATFYVDGQTSRQLSLL